MKFIIFLQFWAGDKVRAMRLARFIADIESGFRTDVEFVFVARFDCEHDHDTIRYVNAKFRVNWITSLSPWTGWPGGCNGMALDTLQWLGANRPQSWGALLIEPDCVPVHPFWINHLMAAWEEAGDAVIMGAWRDSGGAHGHINGNCVVRPSAVGQLALQAIGTDLAWDCAIAPYVRKKWKMTGVIKNCFDSRNATAEILYDPSDADDLPVLVHGFKDDSAYLISKDLMKL